MKDKLSKFKDVAKSVLKACVRKEEIALAHSLSFYLIISEKEERLKSKASGGKKEMT